MKNLTCAAACIFLLFTACKKHDKAQPGTSEPCIEYNNSGMIILSEDTLRTTAVFNPTNPNEIAYIRFISPGKQELFTYNLGGKTFTQTLLPSAGISGSLFWNSKNAFTYRDTSWIINSDNKQPFVLKTQFRDLQFVEWNKTSDHAVFFANRPDGTGNTYIADAAGNITDSVYSSKGYFFFGGWSADDKIASSYTDSTGNISVVYFNLSDKKPVTVCDYGKSYIFKMCWHPDNVNLYVAGNKGIIRINTLTKESETIFPFCQSNAATHISISGDGKYLLASLVKVSKKDGAFVSQRLIRLIDLATKAQRDLELP